MNKRIDHCLYQAGLTAQGCWEDLDTYTQEGIEKFAELIVRECCIALNPMLRDMISRGKGRELILEHFGFNPKEITTAMLDAAITQCEQELAKKKSGVE
jgi:hypothetical protein